MNNKLALLLAVAVIGGLSCAWTEKDSEEFYGMLIVGTVVGVLFGIICMVFVCLPLCCGMMKEQAEIVSGRVVPAGSRPEFRHKRETHMEQIRASM